MTFRALAIDLDGTLLQPDETISARDEAAVRAAIDAGYRIIVATARWHEMADRVAAIFDLSGPIIACSGAQVRVRGEQHDLFDARLPLDFTEALFRTIDAGDCVATIVCDEEVLLTLRREPDMSLLPPEIRYVPSLATAEASPVRIALVQGDEALARIDAEVLTPFAGQVHARDAVTGSGRRVLTVTAPNANKGAALEAACRHLGIAPAEVVAFGDSDIDISMFVSAGASVAMGQASEIVRAAATWVSGPHTESGVAQGIERLLEHGRLE